jgi:hypothetical protein
MSRILFAWELGGGYGHLGPFRPIAEVLMERGHQVTIAAREIERASVVFGATAATITQAPLCSKTYSGIAEPPLNYAEILMRYGYLDAPQLRGLVRAWRGLLDLTEADVVVADHAPTALLAARATGHARVVTGSPFTIPPLLNPMPNMRSWIDVPAERLANSDASVLKCINASLPAGTVKLDRLSELFEGAEQLIAGIPETDPFGPRDRENYLGLHAGLIGAVAPRWPVGEGARIFAYLNSEYRHLEATLAALAASGERCVLFVVGITAALRGRYESERMVFSDGLLDMDLVVSDCDFCVCHGNFGTVCEVLRRGKPLLILPIDLEKYLLGMLLAKDGVARYIHPDLPNPDVAVEIRRMLDTPTLRDSARVFAERHGEPPIGTIVARAADRIERLARTQGGPG